MPSVLFVCTGKICRAPMAAAFFTARLPELDPNWLDWRVESAGTWTTAGRPAALLARQVMAERGIDISRHRSREVSQELLEQFDLILTMETGQKEALQVEFAHLAGRIYLLSEMSGAQVTIEDPMGGPPDAFHKTAAQIERYIRRGQEYIVRRLRSGPIYPSDPA